MVQLDSATALMLGRCLLVCSVDVIVVCFEVFCGLAGCTTSSGVISRSACRSGGAGRWASPSGR